MPSLRIFGLKLEKSIVTFAISTLEFVKNDFLTHTVNFGIDPPFSKGLRYNFSESPRPVPCPLYKVSPKLSTKIRIIA